jgi:hypothetical protein
MTVEKRSPGIRFRWCKTVLLALCCCSGPIHGCAETPFPIPRTSVTTQQQIREEVRYLQEETIVIATRRDRLAVHPSADRDETSDQEIEVSGTVSYPTRPQQEHNIRMAALPGQELVKPMQGHPTQTRRHTPALVP